MRLLSPSSASLSLFLSFTLSLSRSNYISLSHTVPEEGEKISQIEAKRERKERERET
jgi:hypothetical protein